MLHFCACHKDAIATYALEKKLHDEQENPRERHLQNFLVVGNFTQAYATKSGTVERNKYFI